MQKSQPPKPLMLLLAAAFLIEAWVWNGFVAVARRLVAFIPWASLKARIAAAIMRLPAPFALIIFGVPFLIVEPLKTVSVFLMATGHFALGCAGFVFLQFLSVGIIAVLFDLTREKLLTMPWFAWIYDKVMMFHDFANGLIAPYKQMALRELRAFWQWLRDYRARLRAAAD